MNVFENENWHCFTCHKVFYSHNLAVEHVCSRSEPQGKEHKQVDTEAVCLELFLQLRRSLSYQALMDTQKVKNSVMVHSSRERFLLGIDAQSLADLSKRIVEHWPR